VESPACSDVHQVFEFSSIATLFHTELLSSSFSGLDFFSRLVLEELRLSSDFNVPDVNFSANFSDKLN
jgi:hypothetical protein